MPQPLEVFKAGLDRFELPGLVEGASAMAEGLELDDL